MNKQSVTRGYGLLENMLSKFRGRRADALIHDSSRRGRLLDIGCGKKPYFLLNVEFESKFGIDKWNAEEERSWAEFIDEQLILFNFDIFSNDYLPFDSEYFDVVTMLAVFEHIEKERIGGLVSEVRRILKPNGVFILVVPVWWTDPILKGFAKIGLLSKIEIEDHKDVYSPKQIKNILAKGHFKIDKIETGYFEMFMNIWVRATK